MVGGIPYSEEATMIDSSTRSRSDAATTQRWIERFQRFDASNHTVVAFCVAEGVSESNFYLWRRRLASPTRPNEPKLVPIRLAPHTHATTIELTLPSGNILRFPLDTGPELIVAVLRGLEAPPC